MSWKALLLLLLLSLLLLLLLVLLLLLISITHVKLVLAQGGAPIAAGMHMQLVS